MKTETKKEKKYPTLNVILWIVQVILAGTIGMAGVMKTTTPIDELAARMAWAGDIPAALVRFIGISEFLAAIGLLLPSIVKIRPSLTIWAALVIVIVMILALILHISRCEFSNIPMHLCLALLAGFVAWGRSQQAVIHPK